jgi:hypothetical protein
MLERFGILEKFKARFVDLLNLRFSRSTKPTTLTKLTRFWKIAGIGKIQLDSWSTQFSVLDRLQQLDWLGCL